MHGFPHACPHIRKYPEFFFLTIYKEVGHTRKPGYTEEKHAGLPKAFRKTGMLVGLILCSLRQTSAPSAGHDVEGNADYSKGLQLEPPKFSVELLSPSHCGCIKLK